MGKKSYEKIYRATKDHYFKIGNICCPLLENEMISFGKEGWRHMVYKSYYIRPIKDRIRRFKLFKHARIITETSTIYEYRENILDGVVAKFWTLSMSINSKKLKVTIRQIDDGPKHYFSIMN